MISIKTSFIDCKSCSLLDCNSVIADTNSKDDLQNVEVMVVSENPGKTDIIGGVCNSIEYPAGTPLIGEDGQIFRTCFDKYITPLNKKYFITNVVLCQTLNEDGTSGSVDQSVIDKCKENLFNMIKICQPDLIISIGETPAKVFNQINIMDLSGKTSVWNNPIEDRIDPYDILFVHHPSHVVKNGGMNSSSGKLFDSAFKTAASILTDPKLNDSELESDQGKLYMYQIDEQFYNDDYRLVDIQFMAARQKVLFIFRDKNNKKIFYEPVKKDNNYYWYESLDENSSLIEKHENLQLKIGNYNDRCKLPVAYESDIKPAEKHAVDYYLQSKGETPITKQNVLFFDIEVYTGKYKGFPTPEKSEHPISAISFALDDNESEMYLLALKGQIDPNIETIKSKYKNLKIYNDERIMLNSFINRMHELKPDILTGWNIVGFDIPYIYNRMKNLNLDPKKLSPNNYIYIDQKWKACDIYGYVILDMMDLFKELSYIQEPSYKLDSICQKYLGEGKKEYTGSLNKLYEEDIETLISYSFTDTDLLIKLDKKKGHISLQNELRQASTTTHKGASSTIGQADGLFYCSMKKEGISIKNAGHGIKKRIPGAYVRDPEGGIYDWVIDFDYTSLYPSIICSYNIGPNTYIAKVDPEIAHNYTYNRDSLKGKVFDCIMDPIYDGTVKKLSFDQFQELINEYNGIVSPSGCCYKGHDKEKSIFYPIIKTLFEQRKIYKKMMFDYGQQGDTFNEMIFGNKQQSYKILLNSLYGVMAQENFRFYNLDLASTVTLTGQDLIKFAGEHVDSWMQDETNTKINPNYMTDVEKLKPYLKYCDTDSLFLWMEPYLKDKKLPIDVNVIMSEASRIQTWLNDKLLKGYAILHNINVKESMFYLKNELVCKRYYTLSKKKRYALHVIKNEGNDKNEIDVKGIEVRRSDYSDLTKEMLNKIIEMILLEETPNVSDILDYVESKKQQAIKLAIDRDPSIFRTVSFSKPQSEYKNLPQHLKGMLIWNLLEYDHFKHGDRGVIIPLKSFDLFNAPEEIQNNFHSKFLKDFKESDINVIVVPEDVKLPKYYGVDVDKIVSFAVNDRADLLLEPLVKKDNDILLW